MEPRLWIGPLIVCVFVLAYLLVFAEERFQMRKSKPVMIGAGFIWVLVALALVLEGKAEQVAPALRHVLLEYAELFLFLLAAISFVNAMIDRGVFEALRSRLASRGFSARRLFWLTGAGAFVLSPIADNLTTALVMGTVAISALGHDKKSLSCALISIVVAANAGGAFSPFGDITTLMVWQKGKVEFLEFFALFVPSVINWLVPALILSLTMTRGATQAVQDNAKVRKGGFVIAGLFLATIAATVCLDHFLHLPPFFGMMFGFGVLNMYGYFLHKTELRMLGLEECGESEAKPFNVFAVLEKTEWDTLLFFYGIMLCVGGIGAMGYLAGLSGLLYGDLGASAANVIIGFFSAIVDNIPLTYAVLTMDPAMNHGQWLLLTLTAGVGGSLLSIGSAAGVALMGVGRGKYTFMSHLKWSWAIALGYAASIAAHFVLNAHLFER